MQHGADREPLSTGDTSGEPISDDRLAAESVFNAPSPLASTSATADDCVSRSPVEPPIVIAVATSADSRGEQRFPESLQLDGPFWSPGLWVATVCMIYGLAMLANMLVPGIFWGTSFLPRGWEEILAFGAVGGLTSQIAVLAAYCALGPHNFQWRFLVTSLMAIGVASAYIIGLQLPDYPNSTMPANIGMFILAIGFGGFVLAAAAVKGISLLTGERLVIGSLSAQDVSSRDGSRTQSFSIGYLIAVTTVIAIAIALLRAVVPTYEGNSPSRGELLLVTVLSIQHAVYSILLLFGCLMLALRARGKWQGLLAIALLLILAAPANLALMGQFAGMRIRGEVSASLYTYSLGFIITTLGFLMLLRVSGHRLVKHER